MAIPKPKTNFSMLPHYFVDDMMPNISSLAEMKVLLYILRHTWGFQDESKLITLDEFKNGRKRRDGTRIDNGTGLSKKSIIAGIKLAVKHGYLHVETDDNDPARVRKTYSLTIAEEPSNQLTDNNETVIQIGKKYTSGVENVHIGGVESTHRTEKETIERNNRNTYASIDAQGESQKHHAEENGSAVDKHPTRKLSKLGRDALFDWLAVNVYNLRTNIPKPTAGRIGKDIKLLVDYDPSISPAMLDRFKSWWSQQGDVSMPRADKLVTRYAEYCDVMQQAVARAQHEAIMQDKIPSGDDLPPPPTLKTIGVRS